MFYENLQNICNERGTTPTSVCKALGLSTGLPTRWKRGAAPRSDTLRQIAAFLSVPISALLNDSDLPEGINMDLTLFGEPGADNLTSEERHLIDAYRENPTFRAAVDALYSALVPAKKPESSAL